MDVLDGATQLSPDMDTEAQRWLETPAGNPRSATFVSKYSGWPITTTAHPKTEQSPCPQNPSPSPGPAIKRPPPPTSYDPFSASFAANLCHSPSLYDGSYSYPEDQDDRTPLLNAYYQETASPQQATPRTLQSSHFSPLEPPAKASPSLSICLWNEVSHNSQHTRPVADMLREVLEVRYPIAPSSQADGYERLHAGGEQASQTGPNGGNEARSKRRWWHRLLKRRAND